MELNEALAKVDQILDEERVAPSVGYEYFMPGNLSTTLGQAAQVLAAISAPQALQQIRSRRPRRVENTSGLWVFKSANYSLLRALLSRVAKDHRPGVINGILLRITSGSACAANRACAQPQWSGLVSELPLVAEFCVRNGAAQQFFNALGESYPSPAHAILLQHLEDMIALNFTVFNEAAYEQLDFCVRHFLANAERQLGAYPNDPTTTREWAGIPINLRALLHEIRAAADDIQEECRKARYLHVKGSLLDGVNLEVNQDKDSVQSYLRTLGFSDTLMGSLDEAERLYHESGTAFILKASMGHLRSFLESLHKEAWPLLQKKVREEPFSTWGVGLARLRERGIISASEERFAGSLYTLMSDEGVHPLVAEREYARLFRNVVIEYALLFLKRVEKARHKTTRTTK